MGSAKRNFLLGRGELLNIELAPPTVNPDKAHPYSFDEVIAFLKPRIAKAAHDFDRLPDLACPHDQTVGILTLHPTYLAKSYFPQKLLAQTGLRAVGSKETRITPRKWTKKGDPEQSVALEVFVAGSRSSFRDLGDTLSDFRSLEDLANEASRIEDFRPFAIGERVRPINNRREEGQVKLEVVLHASEDQSFILLGFREYLENLGAFADLRRRIQVGALTFLPVLLPPSKVNDLEKFSFLRVARPMPSLRTFHPGLRTVKGARPIPCTLPSAGPVTKDFRVAVFDGGLPPRAELKPWVRRMRAGDLGEAQQDFVDHGLGVTSALLFGPIRDSQLEQPYVGIDHYRVLDKNSGRDEDLFDVLPRIMSALETSKPKFFNLSIGPALPIDDDDVEVWTASLDEYLADGGSLATIAVGNDGDADSGAGLDRVQVPSDCVNGLAVGAADTLSPVRWRRANYSCRGPGRCPGVVKPDVLAFGGTSEEPFYVLSSKDLRFAAPTSGTSFASPSVLRMASGIRAHFGDAVTALGIKAILIHRSDDGGMHRRDVGWGRVPDAMEELMTCSDGKVSVLYQGLLQPSKYVRVPVPVPAETLVGKITVRATFCFATGTDPHHPASYTRSGLDVQFRPHDGKRKGKDPSRPDTSSFFRDFKRYLTEAELRNEAHKWETVMQAEKTFLGSSLQNPVFDVHYMARRDAAAIARTGAGAIPYALVVTVAAPKMPRIYSLVINRYRTQLRALQPIIEVPIRVSGSTRE